MRFESFKTLLSIASLLLISMSVASKTIDSALLTLAKQARDNANIASLDNPNLAENGLTRLGYNISIDVKENDVITTIQKVWYYPNKATIQESGYETIYFNGYNDKINYVRALSLTPDEEVIWFNNDDIQTLDSDSYNVFTEGKEMIVNYVGLIEGSISALEYQKVTDKNKLESFWSNIFYTQFSAPIASLNINITFNKQDPIYYSHNSRFLNCQQQSESITCQANNIPALSSDDSYFFRDESEHIIFSEQNNWQSVIDVISTGFKQAQMNDSNVKLAVSSMITDEMSLDDKISTVHEFVARDIRYVSESEANNAITPHSIERTLSKRYGDCKDKTALLVSMLSSIGVEAYPVLVSTSRRNADKLLLPSVAYFNHAIACFDYDGQEHCIDATNSNTSWRHPGTFVQGKASLSIIDNNAQPNVLAFFDHIYLINHKNSLQIHADGSQTEQQAVYFGGQYASSYRNDLATQSSKEQIKWAKDLYQDVVSDTDTVEVSVHGIDDVEKPIKLITNNEFPPYLDMQEDISAYEYEPWINFELESFEAENEQFDTRFYGSKVESNITITLPDNMFIMSYPADLNLQAKYGSLIRKVTKLSENKFLLETQFQIPSVDVPVNENQLFNNTIKTIEKQGMIRFTARPKAPSLANN